MTTQLVHGTGHTTLTPLHSSYISISDMTLTELQDIAKAAAQ
jgi:hypothetical protein